MSAERASGVVVMHVDITDRQLQEIALRSSEAEQRESGRLLRVERSRLLEAQRVAKIGSWDTDLVTMSGHWSEETFRIHEMEPRDVMTYAEFMEMVHPDDRAGLDADLVASMSSREPVMSRHRLVLPGGRIKYLEERWQVVYDEAGNPTRVSGTCQDITDRHLSEQRIERLNRGYVVLSQINGLIVRVRDARTCSKARVALRSTRVDPAGLDWPVDWPVRALCRSLRRASLQTSRCRLTADFQVRTAPCALAVRTRQPVSRTTWLLRFPLHVVTGADCP